MDLRAVLLFALNTAFSLLAVTGCGVGTTGQMTVPRTFHTATLLPSGMVLIAGGVNQSQGQSVQDLASAELYDPAKGKFTATGSMTTPRAGHTATLLPDGKVLIAGGDSGQGSAELYDPAAGSFTATGSMTTRRIFHTATLLPSGKVLIAGGNGGLASAELYDPTAGSFTATGLMTMPRVYHTATLLTNGLVLIAGGNNGIGGQGALASAELYFPTTGHFVVAGQMLVAVQNHTATLLPTGQVLIAGGVNGVGSLAYDAELYDPITNSFIATGAMSTQRYGHTATLLLNGLVLVVGGNGGLQSAEMYAPATGSFTATGQMTAPRTYHTATLLQKGLVLIAGGQDGNGISLRTAQLYDPTTGRGF